MGKPEITGYEFDPYTPASIDMPELTFDSDGISIEAWERDKYGQSFTYRKYLTNIEVDQLMRASGMKRIYKPRNFRAHPAYGGYRIFCRRCRTTTLTANLPHDVASRHECLYDPTTDFED